MEKTRSEHAWQAAASFAARAHWHQLRRDGRTPYVAHVFRVALVLTHLFGCEDEIAITTALLLCAALAPGRLYEPRSYLTFAGFSLTILAAGLLHAEDSLSWALAFGAVLYLVALILQNRPQYLAQRAGIPSTQYTLLPVGAGNSFIAAIQQNRIDAGMTTEPTVSQLLKTGDAKVLVDMRTLDGTRAALGGTYPASSFYVQRAWAEAHKDEAQKLAHAFSRTLNFIATHSADEIAAKMPKDYYANNKDLYVSALKASLPMFTKDGRMPADGPQTVLNVLSAFNPSVKGKHIDLAKTYSNDYLPAATATASK